MRTRNAFLWIVLFEILALAFASRARLAKGLRITSAVAGLVGLWVLYEASEHGGGLVYAYAGGVGTRSGQSADLRHLLVAGLYHNAQAARDSGRGEDAARLTEELMRQMPGDAGVRFLGVESLIKDRRDPRGALAELAAMDVPADDRRLQLRKGTLTAQAYEAAGVADSATATIAALRERFKDDPRAQRMLDRLSRPDGAR